MALQEFIRESIETNWEWLERYLDGLTQEEIEYRPNDQCHSIGFIVWHYGRALDMWTQTLARKQPQLYEEEWAERLGFAPEAMNVGFGYSAEDLSNWRCPSIRSCWCSTPPRPATTSWAFSTSTTTIPSRLQP